MKRSEAKAAGLVRYSTGRPCLHGHESDRFVSTGGCVQCLTESTKAWKRENPEKARPTKAASSRYYQKHKAEIVRKRREKRPLTKDTENLRQRERRERNPAKFSAYVASYRASKLNATPDWLTQAEVAEIEGMYQFAKVMEKLTGAEYHVDHIVPLQGDSACGLHVPWNLRVVTAMENKQKSNKLIDELLSA
jgi:hypothetical protein